ncbi:hypothetical protein J6T66_01770 [bacterium]|nr:hypothetical protein [bacterium]
MIDSRYGKKDKNKLVNGRNLKLNWFSINNIKNGFKNMFAAVKKHLDEYDKRKTEDFQELTERRILDLVPK